MPRVPIHTGPAASIVSIGPGQGAGPIRQWSDPALNPWTNENPGPFSRLALFGATIFNDRTRASTNVRSNCREQAETLPRAGGNVIDEGFNNAACDRPLFVR